MWKTPIAVFLQYGSNEIEIVPFRRHVYRSEIYDSIIVSPPGHIGCEPMTSSYGYRKFSLWSCCLFSLFLFVCWPNPSTCTRSVRTRGKRSYDRWFIKTKRTSDSKNNDIQIRVAAITANDETQTFIIRHEASFSLEYVSIVETVPVRDLCTSNFRIDERSDTTISGKSFSIKRDNTGSPSLRILSKYSFLMSRAKRYTSLCYISGANCSTHE